VTRRSQTSLGTRSTESSYDEVASASEHGRNLVSAAKVLDRKLEFNPEIVSRLAAAASTGERANAGVRAAASIAAELAVDVELDDRTALSAVRDRLPRLAITLREASRSSDQAVRDLTDGLLAIRGVGVGSASTSTRTTPQRRPDSAYAREPATEPSHRRGWSQADTPVRYPRTSTGPGDLHSPATRYSPLAAFGGRETPRQERVRERYDSGASTSSRQERFDGREGRERESRGLDPIEQSPPGRSNRGSPESAARVAALATKDDSLANSLVHPPQPHNSPVLPSPSTAAALQQAMMEEHEASPATSAAASPATTVSPAHPSRKQTSTASTHTVRPHSFAPAQRREPTTALSNSPAYSQAALAHADDVVVAGAHAKRDSAASLSSMLSRDAVPAATAAIVTATATPAMSPATVAAEDDVEHVEERPERERTGTFGSIEGARVRASVSERFRKHLSGEPAE
jgi:hypothetical protein